MQIVVSCLYATYVWNFGDKNFGHTWLKIATSVSAQGWFLVLDVVGLLDLSPAVR